MIFTRSLKQMANILGLDISRKSETVVLPKPVPGPGRFECVGLDWNEDVVLTFLDGPMEQYHPEYDSFLKSSDGDNRHYFSRNGFFGFVDAAVLHCFVRQHKPSVVVEIGSGFSTRVISNALALNDIGRLICIDPEPRASVAQLNVEHLRSNVQDVSPEWFSNLPSDALFFIDSSHRMGTGSDVNYLFLEVLPILRPGTVIHIHDIHLPCDYPVDWNIERGFLYSEQYLLHALLCFSSAFQILWPGRRVTMSHEELLAKRIRKGESLRAHCSFYIQKIA